MATNNQTQPIPNSVQFIRPRTGSLYIRKNGVWFTAKGRRLPDRGAKGTQPTQNQLDDEYKANAK